MLTVDQVDSRHGDDRVAAVLSRRADLHAAGAVLGPDRTAGDEFQLVYPDARAALDATLLLHREGGWTVGIGVGEVRSPLPASTGEATGAAFVAARIAVDAAKRAQHRVVAEAADHAAAVGVTGLIGLLLETRARRSAEGWEVADLVGAGLTQARIARRLRITPQAVSLRVRTAAVRLEQDSLPAIADALAGLDARA